MNILEFLEIDIEKLQSLLDSAQDLEGKHFFEQLTKLSEAKKKASEALEEVERYESQAKSMINSKAKELYGTDWIVIKGSKFKISRSFTGALYEILAPDSVRSEFVKVKLSPNSRTIESFREKNSSLPDGIGMNDKRGESIRIKSEDD